jgi:hypothetical protein
MLWFAFVIFQKVLKNRPSDPKRPGTRQRRRSFGGVDQLSPSAAPAVEDVAVAAVAVPASGLPVKLRTGSSMRPSALEVCAPLL